MSFQHHREHNRRSRTAERRPRLSVRHSFSNPLDLPERSPTPLLGSPRSNRRWPVPREQVRRKQSQRRLRRSRFPLPLSSCLQAAIPGLPPPRVSRAPRIVPSLPRLDSQSFAAQSPISTAPQANITGVQSVASSGSREGMYPEKVYGIDAIVCYP